MEYKIGSLFDGSGGFPLAGTLCGIEPAWASEVEPYPIAVTRSRFPKMRHLGDISKVNGAEIEPVDIITFGSPCQDLSVAGKQAGIKHADNGDEETTRSGLFMEAVRIIKEMRSATNGKYPSFALWENVPGAFSSNKGEDFRIVLEELIKIVEPSASMPNVPQGGWAYADSFVGDGWSLAWRVFDAQYWGVPQRRRRIHLVLDLTGERARSVLFEREGVRGYFAPGGTPWQDAPADAQGSPGADDRAGEGFDGDGRGRQLDGLIYSVENHPNDSHVRIDESGKVQALTSRMGTGGGNVPMVREPLAFAANQRDEVRDVGDKAVALQAQPGMKQQTFIAVPFCKSARARSADDATTWKPATVANTMNTFDQGEARANELVVEERPVYCLQGNGIDRADTAGCNGKGFREDASYTLNTIDRPAVVYAVDQGGGKSACNVHEDTPPTLTCTHGGAPAVSFNWQAAAGAGLCVEEDIVNPLACTRTPAVIALDRAAFNQGANAQYDPEISDSGVNSNIVARGPSAVAYSMKSIARNGQPLVEQTNPICASDYKDPDIVAAPPRYIVRRLTPTECARLQGFPDWWGDVEAVDRFEQRDFRFWLDVRKTYVAIQADAEIAAARAAIAEEMERATPRQAVLEQKQRAIELAEGRKAKDYTVKQMLTWYNKLHTDSAEYKMWGNGIALPPALYCMQGIRDALDEAAEDDWMN